MEGHAVLDARVLRLNNEGFARTLSLYIGSQGGNGWDVLQIVEMEVVVLPLSLLVGVVVELVHRVPGRWSGGGATGVGELCEYILFLLAAEAAAVDLA